MTRLRSVKVALCVFVLSCTFAMVASLKVDFDLEYNERVGYTTVFHRFGFKQGGTVDFEMRSKPAVGRALVLIFDYQFLLKIREEEAIPNRVLCHVPSDYRVELDEVPAENEAEIVTKFHHEIPREDLYTMVVLHCDNATLDGKGHATLTNDGRGHLSLEEVPLVEALWILVISYGALSLAWMAYSLYNRRDLRALHHLLTLTVLLKWINVMGIYFNMVALLNDGVSDLEWLLRYFERFSEGSFLFWLLLAALGWTTIRSSFSERETKGYIVSMFLYVIFAINYVRCDSSTTCDAYKLTFYVMKFFLTFAIIVALNATVERLRLSYSSQMDATLQGTLYVQLRTYHTFRWLFMGYLILPVFVVFADMAVLAWTDRWLHVMLMETFFFLIYAHICYTFRALPPSLAARFTFLHNDDDDQNESESGGTQWHHEEGEIRARDATETALD